MLIGNNLSVRYQNKTLISNLDICIAPNKVNVVVGPNGAGKSTLLKALCGDVGLNAGEVTYNGICLSSFNNIEIAKIRAVLTQHYNCEFPFTAGEIVNMAHYVHQDSFSLKKLNSFSLEAMEALKVSHLINSNFTHLSGGEKQRVQLARVLCQILPSIELKTPCYLLIDEPTASLDLYHQYQVMQLATQIANRGAGVLAVVHDLSLAASFADTIYMLEHGNLVNSGCPEIVLTKDQLKKTYKVDAVLSKQEQYLPNLLISSI